MTLNYYFEIAKSKLFYIKMKVGVKIEKSDVGAGYQKTGGFAFSRGKLQDYPLDMTVDSTRLTMYFLIFRSSW